MNISLISYCDWETIKKTCSRSFLSLKQLTTGGIMKVELLAPGGSYETVIAALNAGADAVYTGGEKFGARANADNLTIEQLKSVIDLVFILAILPMRGGQRMYLMKAESPGPSVEKLVPKVKNTAMILYGIYTVMTFIEVLLLLISGMPLFDALTTSFGTAGTGGFGIKNDSITGYNSSIQIIVTVFMILFGLNFNIYYLILCKKFKQALHSEELKAYLLVIFATIGIITFNVRSFFPTIGEALKHAAFQVGSIITTTGFSTTNFDLWPQVSKTILIMLMFMGACAGSTGGGIKVSRLLILIKTLKKELFTIVHPRGVKKITMDKRPIEHETVRLTNIFMVAYIFILAFSILLIGIDNLDFTTNFTAVAATLNNIGPGLELVGPTHNFGLFSDFSKFILMFDMLAGRLEIFPMLMLFAPISWKRQ